MSDDILHKVENGIATITLNRPEHRNAMSRAMIGQLADLMQRATDDSATRCVVVRGTGKDFCGGGDVRGFSETLALSPQERRAQYEQRILQSTTLFKLIDQLPKPLVTVLRGSVAGGAMAFALASDFALASETAYFIVAQTKIGLALDSGLSYFLPRAVGVRRAREIALSGRRIDATEALGLGIVTQLLPDAELDASADTLCSNLASAATKAMGLSKLLIQQSMMRDITQQIAAEAEAIGQCAAGHDFVEGVSAFLAKRRAKFEGL